MAHPAISAWHDFVRSGDATEFAKALDDTVSFHSPVVHKPQAGKAITLLYLQTAREVFSSNGFEYELELIGERDAALEFTAEVNGVLINGIDIISWNEAGRITAFKVMIRPLKAINMIHQEMAARLQAKS